MIRLLPPRPGATFLLPILATFLFLTCAAAGQEPPPAEPTESPPPAPPAETAPAETPPAETPPAETPPAETPPAEAQPSDEEPLAAELADRCTLPRPGEGSTWLEWTQRGVHVSVCRTALWFDNLFGKDRVYEERDETFGWIQPSLTWDERDGFEPNLRMRAKFSLPHFNRRLNAIFGRTTEEDFVEEGARSFDSQLPETFRDTDRDWLIGLGYSPLRGSRRRFDFTGGLKIRTPPEVFAQGRYRRQWFLGDRDLLRGRQTVFWSSDDGFGTSTRLDVEHLLGTGLLLRWRNVGTLAQRIEGVEWLSELSLFQHLGDGRAVVYQALVEGETDAPVATERFGLRATYRRNIAREWLFLEIRPALEWRRRKPDDAREPSLSVGVGFELQFGSKPGSRP